MRCSYVFCIWIYCFILVYIVSVYNKRNKIYVYIDVNIVCKICKMKVCYLYIYNMYFLYFVLIV